MSSLSQICLLLCLLQATYSDAQTLRLSDNPQLEDFSSFRICPDTPLLTYQSSNVTSQFSKLQREIIHDRQCLQSVLNAYSSSRRKQFELSAAKQMLEEKLLNQQHWQKKSSVLCSLIAFVLGYFLSTFRKSLSAQSLFKPDVRGLLPSPKRLTKPLRSADVKERLESLWREGDQGSGALFVQSSQKKDCFYLLVPVNLGSGRPLALFGTGGDYEADLERAEAYVQRASGELWVVLYKHGGLLFDIFEVGDFEDEHGNICSTIDRTTQAKVVLPIATGKDEFGVRYSERLGIVGEPMFSRLRQEQWMTYLIKGGNSDTCGP